MSFDLEASPFPFHRPEAQTLRKSLILAFPSSARAHKLLDDVGFDTSLIFWEQAAADLWHEILLEMSRHGMVEVLVKGAQDSLPAKSPQRPLFASLLAGTEPAIDPEPQSDRGVPNFIDGDDTVLAPEARLYGDDLTRSIGRIPALIRTLQHMLQVAPAVCRLDVRIPSGYQVGTAFRVADDLLLTNWHVLHDKAGTCARAVTAEFGYESDELDIGLNATAVACDTTSIVADKDDDWAVIRVAGLLPAWPIVALRQAAVPTLNSEAFIIQHPQGDRKRIGYVRNQVTNFTDRVVHYLTDTQQGSSGAPVFDGAGKLIALHHAGGRPQEVVGREPLKKNEGIRIERVIAGLQARGVVVG